MEIKDIVKTRREELGLTLEEVGQAVGVSKTTVQRWESGKIKNLRRDKIADLASALQISPDKLILPDSNSQIDFSKLGNTEILPVPSGKRIPIIGTIACGTPILAQENITGYIDVDPSDNSDFALICKGDSMYPKFMDGDVVLVQSQPTVENGTMAAVLIGDEATLKRVYIRENSLILAPENLNYEPIHLTGEEMNNVLVLGKATGLIRYF